MTVYCGGNFHALQRTVCYCDTADGALHFSELEHERDHVHGFYFRFTGEVIVGIEASGYSTWFVELLEGRGHRVLIGEALPNGTKSAHDIGVGRRRASYIFGRCCFVGQSWSKGSKRSSRCTRGSRGRTGKG